ncbi:MAG TPA: serine protease [Chryseolinea sp.]
MDQFRKFPVILLLLFLTNIGNAQDFQDLAIIKASYGAKNSWRDLTSILQREIRGGKLNLPVGNHTMGGDPIFGEVKVLHVRYRSKRGEFETTVREGENLELNGDSTIGASASSETTLPQAATSSPPNTLNRTTAVAQPSPSNFLNAVVTISGDHGAGTGFVCLFNKKPFLATNQHILAVGRRLSIRTRMGKPLISQIFYVAEDADIALIQCTSIPSEVIPLELANLPDASIIENDSVIVAGNSKGDDVITQTPGRLRAIGPLRIEVDNPVYPGNSGSPIFHSATNKVLGVLTEARQLRFSDIEKASFRSKNSSIKTDVRYFGHRIDSVQKWAILDWHTFQQTQSLIRQSLDELDNLIAYLTTDSERYKDLRSLHAARNKAALIYYSKDHSIADKAEAVNRFLRDIEGFARVAKLRLERRKLHFSQRNSFEAIAQAVDFILQRTASIKQDHDLAVALLQGGN